MAGDTPTKQVLETYRQVDLARFNYPRQDEWVMAWEAMQFVARLAEVTGPRRVIEFGSGRSTVVLASIAKKLGGRVLSFEHRAKFARLTADGLTKEGLSEVAIVAHRRLTLRRYGPKILPTYSIRWQELDDFRSSEFALIDGPPGWIGREAALYELFPILSVGGTAVLDDVNRPGERWWLDCWRRAFGRALEVQVFPTIGEGIGLLRKLAEASPKHPSAWQALTARWRRGDIPS